MADTRHEGSEGLSFFWRRMVSNRLTCKRRKNEGYYNSQSKRLRNSNFHHPVCINGFPGPVKLKFSCVNCLLFLYLFQLLRITVFNFLASSSKGDALYLFKVKLYLFIYLLNLFILSIYFVYLFTKEIYTSPLQ